MLVLLIKTILKINQPSLNLRSYRLSSFSVFRWSQNIAFSGGFVFLILCFPQGIFSMLFPSVVLWQTNICVNLFSVNCCEKAIVLTCDKTLTYSLTSQAYKIQNLTELKCRKLSHAAKAGLPREAYINVLNKTNCVWLLLKYALAYVVWGIIMLWDGFMITANVSNLNQNP